MAWGRSLTGIRFVSVSQRELGDFLHGNVEITRKMREFFEHVETDEQAVAAMLGCRCVALFAFFRKEKPAIRRGTVFTLLWLEARGTYVTSEYRKCGLAKALWQRALNANADCEYVDVEVVAEAGRKLVEVVASENTDRVFRLTDRVTKQISVLRVA